MVLRQSMNLYKPLPPEQCPEDCGRSLHGSLQALHVAIREKNLFQVISLLEKEEINVNWSNPQDGNVHGSLLNEQNPEQHQLILCSSASSARHCTWPWRPLTPPWLPCCLAEVLR